MHSTCPENLFKLQKKVKLSTHNWQIIRKRLNTERSIFFRKSFKMENN